VLFEMVTGRLPFVALNRTELILSILEGEPAPLKHYLPDAPPQLQQIVGKALAKEKEKRYRTALDMMNDLKSLKRRLEFGDEVERSDPGNLKDAAPSGSGQVPPKIGRRQGVGTAETGRKTESIAGRIIGRIKEHKKRVGLAMLSLVLLIAGIGVGRNLL